MEIKATDRPTSASQEPKFNTPANEPVPQEPKFNTPAESVTDDAPADAVPASETSTPVDIDPVVDAPSVTAEPETAAPVAPDKEVAVGVVTDCMKLNLRAAASADAEVLAVIPALTEVIVDVDASTEGFYKVCTAAGIEGFCMKKYVALRH